MIKKLFAFIIVGAICLGSLGALGACQRKADEPEPIEEVVSIDMPVGDIINPTSKLPDIPQAPIVTTPDPSNPPTIGSYASTSEAYAVKGLKGEDGENIGTQVDYPVAGTELESWSFVYVDVINYTAEYHYIRFDFNEVIGAEKVAVAAFYNEQQNTGNPQVGILSESLVDGDNAFVADLSAFRTIDSRYQASEQSLHTMTITRLFIYFDSVPAQNAGDMEGSLVISSIMFLKEGDDNLNIDKSPYISDIIIPDVYTKDEEYSGTYKVQYTTDTEGMLYQCVNVGIKKWSNAYGILRIKFKGVGVESMSIYTSEALTAMDGTSMYTYAPNGDEETYDFDFRSAGGLNSLNFYIDSQGVSEANNTTRTFEVISIEFVETVFVDSDWVPTGNFIVSDEKVGGKAKVTYDANVGWNAVNVTVKNWRPDYRRATILLKGDAEAIGVAANSTVICPIADNPLSQHPFDEETGLYTVEVDLSTLSKLTVLSFYFDSAIETPFDGTRSMEFVGIEFDKGAPIIGPMRDWGNYTVNNDIEGAICSIAWEDRGDLTAITILKVENWTNAYQTFVMEIDSENAFKLALYEGWANTWSSHTDYEAGKTTITISVVGTTVEAFDIYMFWDYQLATSNTVKIIDCYFTR